MNKAVLLHLHNGGLYSTVKKKKKKKQLGIWWQKINSSTWEVDAG